MNNIDQKTTPSSGILKSGAIVFAAAFLWLLLYSNLEWFAMLSLQFAGMTRINSNAAGILPVVQALLGKGAALGTVMAFMMSVIALSAPEMIILRKVLKPRLIAVFVGVVATGIMVVGYVFNLVL
ncbi:MAG: permease [Chlorobiales bacterium]|nr:permease [Chlorobiales bacterium]